jgi:hypothetical protein
LKENTMKNVFATTALILACGLSATASFASPTSEPLSRTQVRAAYLDARANGAVPAYSESASVQQQSAPSTVTRAAVKADYFAARKAGSLPAIGEAEAVYTTSVSSTLTRAAVKAEYLAAQKAGTLPATADRI